MARTDEELEEWARQRMLNQEERVRRMVALRKRLGRPPSEEAIASMRELARRQAIAIRIREKVLAGSSEDSSARDGAPDRAGDGVVKLKG